VLQLTVSTSDPAQETPPFDGAGESHLRYRDFVPPPQVFEQAQNAPHCPQLPFTGQTAHSLVSTAEPAHVFPQALGAGLLHTRTRVWVRRPPHAVVHSPHAPYAPQFPLTIGDPQDRVSVADPEHPAPHELPAIHGRVRVWVPIPHFTEQALHAPYDPHLESMAAVPHDRVSVAGPSHPAPHSLPAIHGRVRVCVPIPHLTEHALHAPNAPILELIIAVPHDLVSERGPAHPAPHSLPAIQGRVRVCVPIPHFVEH